MPFTREAVLYDLFHKDKNYLKEAREIKKRYPDAVTILEIGAGTGKLTEQLVKLGFSVVAIEPSVDMVDNFNVKNVSVVSKKLEDIPIGLYKKKKFDLVLAHYDVFNYIPHQKHEECMLKILKWGKNFDLQRWDPSKGVTFFTIKKVPGWVRIRIGLKWKMTAHLWYFYLGKNFFVEKHTMYL